MPFMSFYDFTMDRYFSTIGIIGLNEMCLNMTQNNILECSSFINKVITFIKNKKRWALYFRRAMLSIPDQDFKTISNSMSKK